MIDFLTTLNTYIWTILGILFGSMILLPIAGSCIGLTLTLIWSIYKWIQRKLT